ncbi:diketogulonate reductase-like aldo/keto reductase [Alkalihalobacillus xiaoxiensis]|uniref:Diketogulonate reductase-like aldo/keto reductase n=1 Tax=Shouchella xiaoxiensis TaxID=766895 RepID=A0ABS2SNL0_9BACI|nr:aldo/keto reductase [Shouchella xiaoxiensis]MBM7837100.1 diketogulonate reductase-like aldo/keto reductase [Shouchella xiaoxiensis]
MNNVTLNNGISMPQLGFGVWKVDNNQAEEAVTYALNTGYRSIDTAMIYQNEGGVGKAIAASSVPREELFITTKVWNADQGYESTINAFEQSLERLGLDYVDLYLVHWPTPKFDKYVETYKALEKLYHDGRVKAIGVCNFEIEHLERILDECDVVPVLNQVECHPYLAQTELKAFCEKHDIYLEAWSPLDSGGEVLQDEQIKAIASSYNKSVAQVILRWHLQNKTIVIPKSVTPSRIEENLDVFDFELTPDEVNVIHALDRGQRRGTHPNEMNKFQPLYQPKS